MGTNRNMHNTDYNLWVGSEYPKEKRGKTTEANTGQHDKKNPNNTNGYTLGAPVHGDWTHGR